jgi:hypothetical protein
VEEREKNARKDARLIRRSREDEEDILKKYTLFVGNLSINRRAMEKLIKKGIFYRMESIYLSFL